MLVLCGVRCVLVLCTVYCVLLLTQSCLLSFFLSFFLSVQVCVVAFNTTSESNINIYSLADCLKDQSKWELATLQNPPGEALIYRLFKVVNGLFREDRGFTMGHSGMCEAV